ncbi:MAG: S8 family serine peptidase, partial [Anaerolineae bacterium]|nr:S8 family serine peptidase [Anaerolineae bacterium]
GAALNHRSPWILTSEASNLLTYFSSRGPVNLSGGDGRAKPDVIAPGADVLSTRSNYLSTPSTVGLWGNEPGDGDGDGRPDYAWSGGTSMSSPLVTGAATILRDYFQDIQGLGSTTPPSAALIKAALVNGAVDMGYGYESLASPPAGKVYYGGRNLQGWGFVNVEQSITPRAPRSFFFDDFTNITNSAHQSTMGSNSTGDYVQYTIVVADSSEPLKVTLTWTDYQGGSSSYAVNNLNLLVTAPGGATYYGNNFSGSWSVTGGSYDAKNNTEAVYLQNPTAGTWTVRVTDASHGSGTQPFALFVSGGLGINPSWTRTCSGTAGTCANARGGTSGQTYGGTAVNYFPSLKPLIQPKEHTPAGESFTSSFRLTNWGRSADTISLSSAVTDMTGDSVTNVTVAFSPTGPFALTSGATQDVQVTITVGGAVPKGAYDVMITAASAGTGSRKDAMVIPLNVLPNGDLSNEMRVVSLPGAQVMLDFWATGQTLWAGYLSGEDHNNGEGVVWASCSTDGGTTWIDVGLVSAEDGAHYYGPAIAGNSTGSSVTFVWVKANLAVYARTWTRTSGCTGTWRSIQTLATYPGGNYRIAYPDVIYDTDGTILVTWRKNDNASGGADGIFSNQSTNDGASYGTAAGVPDASGTDATHTMPQLTLDTTRNEVWMAYRNSSNSGDVRLKRWVGSSNSWDAAGTRHISVAATTDVETRPGIGYVAATNSLWVTWHRYASAANATARLYYVRSSAGTLPDPTWGATQQYPVGVRTAELHPAMVVGDASYAYISYLAYNDALRGGNAYALRAPAAGGAPDMTYQLSATVDDPPLYARGNAGSPRLMWATTTVNGSSSTGPALLYTKNPPNSGNPDYGGNLGVAQTLYNLEENLDVYLSQVGVSPTAVELARFEGWPEGLAIHVEWETVTEIDNLGFNLYRAESPDGPYVKLNEELIPSQAPGSPVGAVYVWLDEAVQAGQTYYYKLEDVDVYGHTTMHGPVEVRAGPTLRTRP